jgi:hypothetical protein
VPKIGAKKKGLPEMVTILPQRKGDGQDCIGYGTKPPRLKTFAAALEF